MTSSLSYNRVYITRFRSSPALYYLDVDQCVAYQQAGYMQGVWSVTMVVGVF